MAAISCVVIVCAGTFSAMNLLVPDAAIAGKNGPVTTEEGNNTIVKEGRGEPGENAGEENIIVDDWKKVADVKKKYPQLLIPQYVPEGYEFSELAVEANELVQAYTYTYALDDKNVVIIQTNDNSFKMIKEFDRVLEMENGIEIKIKEDVGKCGFFLIEEELFEIIGELQDSEYEKVAMGLMR